MNASSTTSSPPLARNVRPSRSSLSRSTTRPSGLFGLTMMARSAPAKRREIVDLRGRMAGDRRGPRMLGIGRPQHQRLAGAHQRSDAWQQDLRAGRRHHIGRRRRAIGCRPRHRPVLGARGFRQSRQGGGGQLEKRIGVRIDTGREVDERLRRVRKERPRPAKAPTMVHRRNRSIKKLHVDPDRFPVAGHRIRLGYPDWLFRAIGHPVTWFGRLISFLDRRLNRATDSDALRRRRGLSGTAGHRAGAGGDRLRRCKSCSGVIPAGIVHCRNSGDLAAVAEEPRPSMSRRWRRARHRRTRHRPHCRLAHRRPRSGNARPGRRLPRGDREPGREFFRRHRRTRLLDSASAGPPAAPPTRPPTPPIR